jgi:hypothetical protein
MKRLALITLLLVFGISGCTPQNPNLANPPHGSFNLTVDKLNGNGTVAARYSDGTTVTAHNPYFPKLKAPAQAFADVGFLPNREPDILNPLIVWYVGAQEDGYTYDPKLIVQDGIRTNNHPKLFWWLPIRK